MKQKINRPFTVFYRASRGSGPPLSWLQTLSTPWEERWVASWENRTRIQTIFCFPLQSSKNFELYCRLCSRAFMILRRNADLIINLFSIMRWTGIPELTCVEDTNYIRNALVLEKSELEAEKCFKNVINKCIDLGWTVQVMWAFHKMKHVKSWLS